MVISLSNNFHDEKRNEQRRVLRTFQMNDNLLHRVVAVSAPMWPIFFFQAGELLDIC